MKKVLLVVALLLLATPVFAADVNVTATLVGAPVGRVQKVRIGYDGAAEANSIRAFAISVKVDNTAPDANIQNIGDFNRGESTKPNGGYGIFPARFRQYITPLNGSQVTSTGGYGWQDGNYTPLAVWGDANAGWGDNTKWIVTELGTLYSGDANAPGKSGTLFTVDVNGSGDCNLCLELDQTRGGVVKSDTTGATVGLPLGDVGTGTPAGCIKVVWTPPSYTVSGRVVGAVAPKSVSGIGGVTMSGLPGNPITDSAGNYTVVCTGSGTCTPTDPNGQWTFVPASFSYSAAMTQNVTGTALECLNKLDTGYTKWVSYNKPDCWCYQKQCRGDADGAKTLSKPVASPDLTIFKAGVGQTAAYVKTLVVSGKPGICADFDRKDTLSKPIASPDLTIFKSYVGVADTSVPQCPSATVNAWKN